MSFKLAERGLASDGNMAVAAKDYQRSKAGIVLQVVVGILTLGIGAIGVEIYHAKNKSQKQKEFINLAGELLKAMQSAENPEEGFKFNYRSLIEGQESEISVARNGKGVTVSMGGETINIPNKTLGEIRENLKRDILSNADVYGPELAKLALKDEEGGTRSLAAQFLESRVVGLRTDLMSKDEIREAATRLIDNKVTGEELCKQFNPKDSIIEKIVDQECLEMIAAWKSSLNSASKKVIYTNPTEAPKITDLRKPQSKDEIRVRKFLAELFFPENAWRMDTKEPGARVRSVLLKNPELLAELYSRPELIDTAGLPKESTEDMKLILNAVKEQIGIKDEFVTPRTITTALELQCDESYNHIAETIDNEVEALNFSKIAGADLLQKISLAKKGEKKGDFEIFIENVLVNYFSNQATVDKRAMLASFLENSGSNDADEVKLMALLKASGPYMQKMLQLLSDNAEEGNLKTALDDMKTNLSPINERIVEAMLTQIVVNSGGKIQQIDVKRSLGAASVGQTLLANVHWNDKPEPEEVVIKLLRPGVRLRADREVKFFEEEALKVSPAMGKTFEGVSEQIKMEMDLTKEAHFVELAKVYDVGYENMQAMKLIDKILPSQNYMLLSKAPGVTVKSAFDDLGKKIENGSFEEASKYSEKLTDGIRSLTKKWVAEALFGTGFYHGDLHAGNIMFSPDINEKGMLTAIDFGNAAILSRPQRKIIFKMVLAATVKNEKVFVRNYEKLLSNEGIKKIDEKEESGGLTYREKLILETKRVMNEEKDPGLVIKTILDSANKLGLEIPATVTNFSRSQMMLQNAINRANEENIKIRRKFAFDARILAQNCSEISEKVKVKDIYKQATQRLAQLKGVKTVAVGVREELELIASRAARADPESEKLGVVDFGDLMMNVMLSNVVDSGLLARGDIINIVRSGFSRA